MAVEEHELIIVGAGPAGLCAALYAGRSEMDAVLLERGMPGGQLLLTDMVDDYPGMQEWGGMEMAQEMADHAARFGVGVTRAEVTALRREEDGTFRAETDSGTVYRAPAVIFTAGGEPRRLDVPGEEEFQGKGVSYCAICDGAFFKGEEIAVVGGGDSAVEEGHFLTRYADKVHVIHRRDEFSAQAVLRDRLFAAEEEGDVEITWNAVVERIQGDEDGVHSLKLRRVRTTEDYGIEELDETWELEVSGVFIFIGFSPNTDILGEHLEHDAAGYIVTDRDMRTSVPGLFVAGDVRSQLVRQITTAVGDATTAVFAAEKYLAELEDEEKAEQAGAESARSAAAPSA
jgi:thioredoxin reductase (NADPH)